MSRVLVAGVYPPVPGPAAEATLAAVRWHLGRGDEVEVVSPRPGAAHHHGPLVGTRAAALLGRLAAEGAYDELTLCLSAGVPFPGAAGRGRAAAAGRSLAGVLGRFGRVRVLVAEPPAVPVSALAGWWPAVAEVLARPGDPPAEVARRLGAPPAAVATAPFDWDRTPSAAAVTATGPAEGMPARQRLALVASYLRHPARIPPWALHRARVALGPWLKPVLVRRGWWPAR